MTTATQLIKFSVTDQAIAELKQKHGGIVVNFGEVYIPASITDNEQYAAVSAIQDGEQIVDIGDGHALLRLNWLKENFSGDDEMRQEFERMEKNIKQCASA